MALKILTSSEPYSEQRVTIGGISLTLTFKYNSRNSSWYMDIKDGSNTNTILSGIKIMPNQNLTGRYILKNFPSGNFWCIRQKNDFTPINRDNFGSDKVYALYWLTSQEEGEAQIDNKIQL